MFVYIKYLSINIKIQIHDWNATICRSHGAYGIILIIITIVFILITMALVRLRRALCVDLERLKDKMIEQPAICEELDIRAHEIDGSMGMRKASFIPYTRIDTGHTVLFAAVSMHNYYYSHAGSHKATITVHLA